MAKHVSPSVVNISFEKVVKGQAQGQSPFGPDDPMRDFFDRYFGQQMPREYKQRGLGTGFIIDKAGFILTNNHVVEDSDEITVKLADDREFSAKIIGRDPMTDLALIQIDAKGPLAAIALGDSDKLEVGDWVVAIGNPFGLGNTVTAGIVSAKYRQIGAGAYDNFIQTDASINPGNSGGPLLNTSGEAVGINSAIFSQSGGSVGIGFAIPINMAKDLLPQLKTGKVVRGWLGVMIQKITPELKETLKLEEEKGALVGDVTAGGPAQKAGIQRGDVIVAFDGKEIKDSSELPYRVAATPVGKVVPVGILRKGQKTTLQVKIGELKADKQAGEEGDGQPESTTFGMHVETLTPEIANSLGLSETSGVVVVEVATGGPAADGGIQAGDVILEVNQEAVKDLSQFNRKIKGTKAGDTILLLINRKGATLFLTLKNG
ncbi:MAG: DegQ family serine endoprotease [Deltaproteobacteria bacterium]|nr:DegQ family serine endoprotease [Deltaproteobacteria bacterium]